MNRAGLFCVFQTEILEIRFTQQDWKVSVRKESHEIYSNALQLPTSAYNIGTKIRRALNGIYAVLCVMYVCRYNEATFSYSPISQRPRSFYYNDTS